MAFDLEDWLQRSVRASGVPVKVQQPAVLAALQALVATAKRTKEVTEQGTVKKPK